MRLSTRLVSSLAAVAAACAIVPSVSTAAEEGPAPTVTSLRATWGPYPVSRTGYTDAATPGFGAGSVYYPTGATKRLGVVAFAPGFTENSSAVSWLAQRVASHGFVTVAFNVNNTWTDFPYSRAGQLLAAIDFVTTSSKQSAIADPARTAVVGHSMGGGGTLDASRLRPELKAAVGLAPWNPGLRYDDVTVPALEIGAQNDFIAPVAQNARVFYNSLPQTTPKTLAILKGAGHFATNSPTAKVGAATVAWLKRYVDGDTRYAPFICGAHTAVFNSELSGFASNC